MATSKVAGAVESVASKLALACSGRGNVEDREINLVGFNEDEVIRPEIARNQ
jgi:translation initiation factor 1 (eIF-1/SUI1)